MNYKAFIISFLFFLPTIHLFGQCAGNVARNGDLSGTKGVNTTAANWNGYKTPDINDHIGQVNTTLGFIWVGTPLPSPNGGTWQNCFGDESIEQNLIVVPGETYSLRFQYAAQGIQATFVYDGPVGVNVYLDSVLIHTTQEDTSQYTWEYSDCINFTATSSLVKLKLEPTQSQYVGIDGVCIVQGFEGLGNDTALCSADTITLDGTTPNASYLWQDSSINSTLDVIESGIYWLETDINGCVRRDSVLVQYDTLVEVDLGMDTTLCQGDTLTLSSGIPNANYLWQDSSRSISFTLDSIGNYWLEVSNECGVDRDTVFVDYDTLPTLNLGMDTTLCSGDSLFINAATSDVSYLWQDSSTNSFLNVSDPGLFWLELSHYCGMQRDSINVLYDSIPVVDLGMDTILCNGENLVLQGQSGAGVSYLWQDSSTSANLMVTNAGLYWLESSNLCGNHRDSIQIGSDSIPQFDLGNDTTLCAGATLILDATSLNSTYLWQDSSTLPNFTVQTLGTYSVMVNHRCGTINDFINVQYDSVPNVNLGSDTTLCQEENLLLMAPVHPNAQYQWNNGSTAPELLLHEAGTYWLQVQHPCGSTTDSIEVGYDTIPKFSLGPDTNLCEGQSPNS